jgi:hypothetical protein
MNALLFQTQADAEIRNHEEAVSRGCTGVTHYWWPMTEYEGQWALLVNGDPVRETEVVFDIEPSTELE